MSGTLEAWIEAQTARAVQAMLRSISATELVKTRPGFGQTIRPLRGSIVASPVLGAYDPDPDYFFHWYRDSALVIDALRLLQANDQLGPLAIAHLADFVRFSAALARLDGRALVADAGWRAAVAPDFERFVRPNSELASAHGAAIPGETRVNPDGTLDISRWGRPQHDGPALRALALLRWTESLRLPSPLQTELDAQLRVDLYYTLAHGHEPCVDIWEEEVGRHYYTLRVASAALESGGVWLARRGECAAGEACQAQSRALLAQLDDYWIAEAGHYRSRVLSDGARSSKELDIAVVLATVHARGRGLRHSPLDPKVQATLARLEALFDAAYPINHGREPDSSPALGRYAGDVYYSGGAYFFATLGAAELCYLAGAGEATVEARRAWLAHGDGFLQTVRRYTPADGQMAEQFDQRSGAPSSAKHLAWSYAAFLTCVGARRDTSARAGNC